MEKDVISVLRGETLNKNLIKNSLGISVFLWQACVNQSADLLSVLWVQRITD